MKKAISILLVALILVTPMGTMRAFASEKPQAYFEIDAEKWTFPNGNVVYFEACNDLLEKVDTSGYVSGVYNNWPSKEPLYTIDFGFADIFNGKNYFFSSTATNHVEFYKPGHTGTNQSPALTFYEYEQVKKTWSIDDLIKDQSKLEHTSIGTIWYKTNRWDLVNNALHLETVDGQYMSFDIYTGELLYRSDISPFSEITIGSSVIITGAKYHDPRDYTMEGHTTTDLADEHIPAKEIPLWVRCEPHIIAQIEENRVLLGAGDGINSWVPKSAIVGYINMEQF